MDTQGSVYAVGTESLNIIQINFMQSRLVWR
jgi:hypothetical protein